MAASSKRLRTSAKRPCDENEEIRFATGKTSFGSVVVASSEKGVVSIEVGEDPDELLADLQNTFPKAHLFPGDRNDRDLIKRVIDLIESPAQDCDLPLDIRGTAFQKRVWRAVMEIPVGQTSTYTEIARKIGAPKAMRAVGSACCNSKLAFIIPCHRVLRSDGTLSSGSDRQETMLARERDACVATQR